MLFKRISRATAETVFLVAKNVSGSTVTAGYSVVFDVGASVDGVRVTQGSAVDLGAYAGVADADIANSAYGLIQVYGYRSAVYLKTVADSSTYTSGSGLLPVTSIWALTPTTVAAGTKQFAFLCETITDSSDTSSSYYANFKGFIRAL